MPEHRNIADLVYAYQPRAISPAEWQVVRPYVVAVTETNIAPLATSRADLRNHMLAVTMAATTAASLGRELTHENVFDPEVIEYAINRATVSSRVKGARRSILVGLGRELNGSWPFADTQVRYGYKAPDAPYTEHEVAHLFQWAAGQSTEYQRRSATVLLALGLGAGLRIGGDGFPACVGHCPNPRRNYHGDRGRLSRLWLTRGARARRVGKLPAARCRRLGVE